MNKTEAPKKGHIFMEGEGVNALMPNPSNYLGGKYNFITRDDVAANIFNSEFGAPTEGNRQKFLNSVKQWLYEWADNDFALTLHPVKKEVGFISATRLQANGYNTSKGWQTFREMTNDEIIERTREFARLLAKEVYKRAAKKYNKKFDILVAIEDKRKSVDKHIHLCIKGEKWITDEIMMKAVAKALRLSQQFYIEQPAKNRVKAIADKDGKLWHLSRADGGWAGDYMTKDTHDIELKNLYLL